MRRVFILALAGWLMGRDCIVRDRGTKDRPWRVEPGWNRSHRPDFGRMCEYHREDVEGALRTFNGVRQVDFLNDHGTVLVQYQPGSEMPEQFAECGGSRARSRPELLGTGGSRPTCGNYTYTGGKTMKIFVTFGCLIGFACAMATPAFAGEQKVMLMLGGKFCEAYLGDVEAALTKLVRCEGCGSQEHEGPCRGDD